MVFIPHPPPPVPPILQKCDYQVEVNHRVFKCMSAPEYADWYAQNQPPEGAIWVIAFVFGIPIVLFLGILFFAP